MHRCLASVLGKNGKTVGVFWPAKMLPIEIFIAHFSECFQDRSVT